MARIRTIKPEFPQSESMGRVKREARLCFILLFTLADDAGRLRGNSRMLASLLYPYDDDAKSHIEGWLNELHLNGCIQRYEVDGDQYIEICKWLIHQKIDKPSPSKIPPPTEDSRVFAKPREDSSADQGEDQGVDQGREKPRKRVARPDDVDEQVWDDWMALRKAKRAPVTETVLNGAKSEAAKAGLSLDDFLRIWCRRGSQGLEASWIKEHELPARPTFAQQAADVARVTVPAKQGPDPTLQRLIEDGLKAVPPPPDVRQKLAELRVSTNGAPQKDGAE